MILNIGLGGLTALRLLAICELALSAMVLPRPPSSPNEISREAINLENSKYQNDKTLYSLLQLNTNVEKPNTDGYRLLEIELHGDEMDETNLQGLVRAMLGTDNDDENETVQKNSSENDPKPEVIPNSILGVRDMGLSPNYRINRSMMEPPVVETSKYENVTSEKLYYLKNTRPKVDVRVRGKSGSFTDDTIVSRVSNDRLSISSPSDSTVGAKNDEKIRLARKFEKLKNSKFSINTSRRRFFGNGDYVARPDRSSDESTTENMSVTSSELPKQIPPPPSRLPNFFLVAQTTPVQKYSLRRTDILPGYSYSEA